MELINTFLTDSYPLFNWVALPGYIWILLILAFVLLLFQTIFYFKYFYAFLNHKTIKTKEGFAPSVSIVICARNEKVNLQNNLPSILEQDYPNFEVVVVNDCSWDGTEEVLSIFKEKYPHLKIVELNEKIKRIEGKKFPLTLGIKATTYDILLLTDADCRPVSNQWIRNMVAPYQNEQTELVLGYSPYSYKPTLLNLFVRAETALTALQYFSFAIKGKPYMGVGRNLSYRKELFFRHKGFASHHHIPAGDDDLFVRDAATPQNTAVVFNPDSRMISSPKTSFTKWITQKRRHLFIGKFYNKNIKKALGSFTSNHFLFWLLITLSLIFTPNIYPILILIFIRWMIQWPLIYKSLKRLGYKSLTFFLPILDVLYVFYAIFAGLILFFSKKPKW